MNTMYKTAGLVPISAEMRQDALDLDIISGLIADASRDAAQRQQDRAYVQSLGLEPMDYRPSRTELRLIQRPQRVRANIRRNLNMTPQQHAHLIRP